MPTRGGGDSQTEILNAAKELAQTGDYANCGSLQTRLLQLGYAAAEIDAAFNREDIRHALNALCQAHRGSRDD